MILTTYYKRHTTTNLIIRNNQCPQMPTLKKTNLIYLFTWKHDSEHQNRTYIGQTTTTLSLRLAMHLASGGPKQHTTDAHKIILNRENIVNNTKILHIENDY